MMRCILVLPLILTTMLVATAAAQDAATAEPEAPAVATSAQTSGTGGPMRVELVSLFDTRVSYVGELPQSPRETRMQLNFRVVGDRVNDIVRMGNLIIDEMIDSEGSVMVDPAEVPERARTATRPYFTNEQLRQLGFIHLQTFVGASNRSAAKIASLRGYINVAYSGEAVRVDIERPLSYLGKIIDHPRLREFGVQVRLLGRADLETDAADKAQFGLEYIEGYEKVRNVTVYNEWLRAINTQDTRGRLDGDRFYQGYRMLAGELTNDCELAIFVFPTLEEERIDFSFSGVDLP